MNKEKERYGCNKIYLLTWSDNEELGRRKRRNNLGGWEGLDRLRCVGEDIRGFRLVGAQKGRRYKKGRMVKMWGGG